MISRSLHIASWLAVAALAVAACVSDDARAVSSAAGGGGDGGDGGPGAGGQGVASGAGGHGGADAGPQESSRTRYPAGARHSPMSAAVVGRLGGVIAGSTGRHDVFAKVGDSITVNPSFLGCFAGSDVNLAASAALEPTRAFFTQTLADGSKTSFDRATLAAVVGWSAGAALTGSPSPIAQEVSAIAPAFAVIMFGTNDTYPGGAQKFERSLLADVDALLALGVVPLMSTIPPRGDSAVDNALVPETNAIIRAIAQYRQVPLMDFWATLVDLPDYGLAGDNLHPAVYLAGGVYHGCWFTDPALLEGMNQRNRITLESLDRARRFLLAAAEPEPAPPDLAGAGTPDDPFVVDALPFVDDRDTSTSSSHAFDVYSCAPQDESGPELVYRITLEATTKLRATVYSDAGADIDLHWLTAPAADACVARDDKAIELTAGPGTYTLVADTFVTQGVPQSGGYRLTIVELP